MPTSLPVVVHVVGSGGVNVAAIVASVVTGLLGALGIAATWLQGKRGRETDAANLQASIDAAAANLRRTITAENDRADRAEKRRIYAHLLAACTEVQRAWIVKESAGANSEWAQLEYGKASAAVVAAASEVQLISPVEIGKLAQAAAAEAGRGAPKGQDAPDDYFHLRARLLRAMRMDLGVPADPADHQPAAPGEGG